MKTFIIDMDSLLPDDFRDIIGFMLTVGLSFRKIDLVKDDKTSSVLVVETKTPTEEKAFKDLLKKNEVKSPITILSNNNATVGLKVIGKFKQLGENAASNVYYMDKTTGKKFVITQ